MNHHLYHHGILGQRWGKRNGPPYPLDASDHSSSERKASWKKSIDKRSQNSYTDDNGNVQKEKKHLTQGQKRAIKIGVAAAATALAAYGTYRLAKSGKLNELVSSGKEKIDSLFKTEVEHQKFGDTKAKEFLAGNADFLNNTTPHIPKGFRKLTKSETISEVVRRVNPLLGKREGRNNCSACGIAFFLRSHFGVAVTAKGTGGKMQNLGGVVEKCFKGAKVFDGSAVKFGLSRNDAADMLLRRFGQNSEGVVSVKLKDSGGHIFNWKTTNGVVQFFDGQQGLTDGEISKRYWNLIDPNGFLQLARLDGLEVNWDAIREFVKGE